jgi:hypothetical protein
MTGLPERTATGIMATVGAAAVGAAMMTRAMAMGVMITRRIVSGKIGTASGSGKIGTASGSGSGKMSSAARKKNDGVKKRSGSVG